MEKIRHNVYVYFGVLVAFLAVLLFGIFLGPEHPALFFLGIVGLATFVIWLYFQPSRKDALSLVLRVTALCTVASLANTVPNNPIAWLCVLVLFAASGETLCNICRKGMKHK